MTRTPNPDNPGVAIQDQRRRAYNNKLEFCYVPYVSDKLIQGFFFLVFRPLGRLLLLGPQPVPRHSRLRLAVTPQPPGFPGRELDHHFARLLGVRRRVEVG